MPYYTYSQQSLNVFHVLHAVHPKTSDLLLTLGSAPLNQLPVIVLHVLYGLLYGESLVKVLGEDEADLPVRALKITSLLIMTLEIQYT
jgi:hypothetical protein